MTPRETRCLACIFLESLLWSNDSYSDVSYYRTCRYLLLLLKKGENNKILWTKRDFYTQRIYNDNE